MIHAIISPWSVWPIRTIKSCDSYGTTLGKTCRIKGQARFGALSLIYSDLARKKQILKGVLCSAMVDSDIDAEILTVALSGKGTSRPLSDE